MRRRLAARAEVAGRADEALAEVVQPDTVDHHARGERVVLARDGAGELQSAGAVLEGLALLGRKDREELARDLCTRVGWIAALEDDRLDDRSVFHRHRARRAAG